MNTISVITPVYNGEQFIEACIKNVIHQECLNVEHIIVDGASKDRTVEIIKRYAALYSHIKWISEKDKGQSDAMNKGIAMAKGEILSFLNVDDYYESNVLNRVLEIFKNLPTPTLLVGNCNVWESEDKLMTIFKPSKLSFLNLLMGLNVNNFPTNPSAYFYHACLHQQIGLYEVDEHYAMDVDFLLRAVQFAKVQYVDEVWGNWMRCEGTKTHSLWQTPEQGYQLLNRILRYYRKDLPLLQRWAIAIYYESTSFYERYVQWRFKHYLNQYIMKPKNILPTISSKLKKSYKFIE